ncbi:hypothetical protein LY78DRAFT_58154 [Colletotrichum sublineola]|nr:hypothetical protein LY78DRAFT_58154 [Colletotrichum sublineola]
MHQRIQQNWCAMLPSAWFTPSPLPSLGIHFLLCCAELTMRLGLPIMSPSRQASPASVFLGRAKPKIDLFDAVVFSTTNCEALSANNMSWIVTRHHFFISIAKCAVTENMVRFLQKPLPARTVKGYNPSHLICRIATETIEILHRPYTV